MTSLVAPFDAYKGKEPYIFVSYAHKNSDIVFEHIIKLRASGFRIWYDEGIDPGTDWSDEIALALNNAASFLVFMSPEAADSHNVKKEIVFAVGKKKHMVCVYIAETELPLGLEMQLGNIQGIPETRFINKHKFYERLMNALPESTKGEAGAVSEPSADINAEATVEPEPKPAPSSPVRSGDFELSGTVLTRYFGSAKILTLPNNITAIGPQAFAECRALESVVIPDGVKSIDVTAFVNCVNLVSLFIPKTVTDISYGAFTNCNKLTVKCWRNTPSHFQVQKAWRGPVAFLDDALRPPVSTPAPVPAAPTGGAEEYEELFGGVMKKYTGHGKEFTIPDKIHRVFSEAFYQCDSIEKVIIPSTVTELDLAAFDKCPNLKSVIIEGRQVKIGNPNFKGCPKLTITCPLASSTEDQLHEAYGGPLDFIDYETYYAKTAPSNVAPPSAATQSSDKPKLKLSENTVSFIPKGTAVITMSDGAQHTAIANTLLFLSSFEGYIGTRLYQGLDEKPEKKEYKREDMIYFEDMEEFKVSIAEDKSAGTLIITDYEGEKQTKKLVDLKEELWFISPDKPGELKTVSIKDTAKVIFNFRNSPSCALPMALIERKEQESLLVPQAYVQLNIGDYSRMIPSFYWSTELPLEANGRLSIKRIKSIELTKVIRQTGMFQPYTEVELTVEKRNGELLDDKLDSVLTLYVLTKAGLVSPAIGTIKKITFNAMTL